VADVDRLPGSDQRVASDESSAEADPSVAPAAVPSVLAVVVAHEPGPWFDDTLAGLAAQDYPRLGVLVVDTGGAGAPGEVAARVAAVLPDAKVLAARPDDRGFGAAANRVLDEGPRAALYLFCHDDLALAPDAVTNLVDEVVRSNAAIVAPKLVMWDDPTRLQHVGLSVDKFGASAPLADEGEIDQAQRDAVTDVFAVPSACMLVRADLFRTLGGFDPGMRFRGDDVDLCWRAQLAGARVMVAPAAVARHREGLADRHDADDTQRLQFRHATRTMLSCWSLGRLALVLPQAALLTIVEVLLAVVRGRFRTARELVAAWGWNLARLPDIIRRRRRIAALRQVSDAEVHRLQVRGSARLRGELRRSMREEERLHAITSARRDLATSFRNAATRRAVVGVALLAVVLIFGSRHLFTSEIPAVGELQPLRGGTRALLSEWWRGWHAPQLGTDAPAPTAYALLGLLGIPLLGHAALLRTVLLLAPLPLGALGMWRLARPFGSRTASITGVATYLALPVAYNGYARGSFSALTLFAAAPWLLGALGRLVGTAPFAPRGRRGGSFAHRALGLGIVVALVGAFVPFAVVVVAVVVLALLLGGLVSGDARGLVPLLAGSAVGALVAFVLHLPWSLTFVTGDAPWASLASAGATGGARYGVAELLRFHTGPFGGGPLSYAVLVTAAFALLLANDVRLAWAVRCWFVALACWSLVWAGEQGWLVRPLPDPGVLLAPAAAALAFATALGVAAFEVDLRRHRFGWRQLAPFVAVASFLVLLLPFVAGAADGRWKLPRRDFSRSYAGLVARPEEGTARILWIGDPVTLPVAGTSLAQGELGAVAPGMAFATTDGRAPVFLDRWGVPQTRGAVLVRDAVERAVAGDTTRLGRLLAVFGVRYVVLADHLVPAPYAGEARPVPAALVRTLDAQLDLERVVSVNEAVTVFRNNSWSPVRVLLGAGTDLGLDEFRIARTAKSPFGLPALTEITPDGVGAAGDVTAGSRIYQAVNSSPHHVLEVEGAGEATRLDAFGWANAFEVPAGGRAALRYETPLTRQVLLAGQALLWIIALVRLNALREKRRTS
jgi:GT2 family glycosyltransferase